MFNLFSCQFDKKFTSKNSSFKLLFEAQSTFVSEMLFRHASHKKRVLLIRWDEQLIFKSLNNQVPQYICNLFQRNSDCSSRDFRNTATDLRLPMYTSSNGQKSFSYCGATL